MSGRPGSLSTRLLVITAVMLVAAFGGTIAVLDIVFRLESAFGLKIPEDEIWQGAFEGIGDDPELLSARLAELKARRPGFRWDRFPERPTRADLARLITVTTIVEDLERRLAGGAEAGV